MSPMSMYTLDVRTLQAMSEDAHGPSPHGERSERRLAHVAMAVIVLALLSVLLV